VLERFNQYEDRGLPFGAWLFRIAHNLLIDSRRRAPRQPHVGLEECDEIDSPSALGLLDQALDQYELALTMHRLTAEQQRVINLRFLEGMTIASTAQTLGKTEESVKKLQARALQAMRRMLADPPPAILPGDELKADLLVPAVHDIHNGEKLPAVFATTIQRRDGRI
jgi:RNA polymerase sigma-70 factor (ECF subfamily)